LATIGLSFALSAFQIRLFSVAILPVPETLSARLIAVRRGLLLAMLAALYLVLWQGPHSLLGRTLFIAHLGLFMLWQPFVQTERRLVADVPDGGRGRGLLLAGAYLKGWMIVLWIMMLAGIIGGKVLLYGSRASRLFYLFALAFLLLAC
jgi:hypothetical protein